MKINTTILMKHVNKDVGFESFMPNRLTIINGVTELKRGDWQLLRIYYSQLFDNVCTTHDNLTMR